MWDWFYLGDKLIIPRCKLIRLIDLVGMVYDKHKIPIKKRKMIITGVRPKEKMHEKLYWDYEIIKMEDL